MSVKGKPLWLLVSDIHFKPNDLDRIVRSAEWIASLPNTYHISRAIICGDLLTARASQQTNVIYQCYRFLNKLVGAVPHVNVILGNHDLAYRSDYTTSALEALAISRLAPFVTLHKEIGRHEWDGRRVFVMPFREDQGQIIKAIHDLDPKSAAATVGFGHLAINRAIVQKHIVNPETGGLGLPTRYPGLTGAGNFDPLARTFTGHFHSHQTILQAAGQNSGDLQGSITYIGAPLQLTWADLFDTRRGAVLLDPETLENKLVENPHAVGYMAVEAQEVLEDRVSAEQVSDKHVMILGNISRSKYVSARERLVKLGARGVRDWKPFGLEWRPAQKGIGDTVLLADLQIQPDRQEKKIQSPDNTEHSIAASPISMPENTVRKPINFGEIVKEYVTSLNLGSALENRQEILTVVGQRLVAISSSTQDEAETTATYRDMLDLSTPPSSTPSSNASDVASTQKIFEAYPVTIEITSFLGVQDTLHLDFNNQFQPGMNFVLGHNGAGKSTIIEALVWCQFGQCVREGLGVNDVINDVVGKDCHVRLTFANGYTISRFRKHSELQNRVVVEKDGKIQPEFEGPTAKRTQESINELLGIDFDTYIRTVFLGNESTRSFLSASPLQKRQLIEAALGLEVLDECTEVCNSLLSQVHDELEDKGSQLKVLTHTVGHLKGRLSEMDQLLKNRRGETTALMHELRREIQKHVASLQRMGRRTNELLKNHEAEQWAPDLEPEVLSLQKEVSGARSEVGRLGALAKLAQARLSIEREGNAIKQEMKATVTRLHNLEQENAHLLQKTKILEVSASFADEDGENNMAISKLGLLPAITLFLRKLWRSILHAISPGAREAAFREAENRQRWHDHINSIATHTYRVTETQCRIGVIADMVAKFLQTIASENSMTFSEIHAALQNLTVQRASKLPSQLTAAVDELKALTARYDNLQREYESRKEKQLRKQRGLEEHEKEIDTAISNSRATLERYKIMTDSKEKEIANYKRFRESDTESLNKLSRQATDLSREETSLRSHQEIFAFWQSAFTRRQAAASRPTFRRHIIERHLGELNKLFGQILMVMYQDAHYAHSVTSGTIGALFKDDGDGDGKGNNSNNNADDEREKDSRESLTSVLDPSLSINPSLAYAKKSSGERKRVDMALFFALFMLGEARSAHMARYMLVDEAFDNLDSAGQASVLKWCRWMTERLAYVIVVTHSQNLVKLAEQESGAAGGVGVNVVTVRGGDKGTELVVKADSID